MPMLFTLSTAATGTLITDGLPPPLLDPLLDPFGGGGTAAPTDGEGMLPRFIIIIPIMFIIFILRTGDATGLVGLGTQDTIVVG